MLGSQWMKWLTTVGTVISVWTTKTSPFPLFHDSSDIIHTAFYPHAAHCTVSR